MRDLFHEWSLLPFALMTKSKQWSPKITWRSDRTMLLQIDISGDYMDELWRFPLPGLRSFSEVSSVSLNLSDFVQLLLKMRVPINQVVTRRVFSRVRLSLGVHIGKFRYLRPQATAEKEITI